MPPPPPNVSYHNNQRLILDAVDKLRRLNATREGVPLPAIVVVGDESSGKTNVLESLSGVSLHRGQDIRLPLILSLRRHEGSEPVCRLEYLEKFVNIKQMKFMKRLVRQQ
ncbi:putative dynamin GTPase [Helianthus anomalus]